LVDQLNDIKNPLIRETLKYFNIENPIEFFSFSDIPARTGLGGSSTYCVGMCYLINKLKQLNLTKIQLIQSAIEIERYILNESGGIQDQIWPCAKGLSSIEIDKTGNFYTKPMPVTEEFTHELENAFTLIYTDEQRNTDSIAKSHEDDIDNKLNILKIAKESYNLFLNENIKSIGECLYESWLSKERISPLISNQKTKDIIRDVINTGAYGAKLLGSGGCGFVLVVSDPIVKQKIVEKYNGYVLNIKFDTHGTSEIFSS
jgi:D-glycero-alpha-D-manno-heptose-7-phosphate kinase